jgi:hypothetical protein
VISKDDLQNRDGGKGGRPGAPLISGPLRTENPMEELDLLKQRIAQARTLRPSAKDLHCEDCFQRGRNAVLRLLDE